jgi:Protein of unknown function (DUF4199)
MVRKNTHWLYGIVTGILVTAVVILLSVTGWDEKPHTGHIGDIPFFLGILLNAIAFSKANRAYVNFADVFKSCFKVACIVACCILIWTAIFITTHPEFVKASMDQANIELAKKHMPAVQKANTGVDIQQMVKYTVPISVGMVYLISGTVYSVICAAIVKKRKAISPAV